MTKVAAKKTAGVLGDDLALNAEQVSGVRADRELPVVWAVAKGSARNKLILVPAALAISAFLPWAVTPLLMIGGLFLCYEGFEKGRPPAAAPREEDVARHAAHVAALARPASELLAIEKDQIKGAIRTDFILSAEIIVIALGTVAGSRVCGAGRRARRHRRADDGRRLRPRRRHRQARRRRPAPEPHGERRASAALAAASCARRRG